MPSISFDIIYENKDGMWELDISGTQLPVSYRAANPTYRNTSILGESGQSSQAGSKPFRLCIGETLRRPLLCPEAIAGV